MLALLFAPLALTYCGTEDSEQHDWTEVGDQDQTTNDDADASTKKAAATTATADKNADDAGAEKPATDSPQTEAPSPSENAQTPRSLNIELAEPNWMLNGVGENNSKWHLFVMRINNKIAVVKVEEGYSTIIRSQTLNAIMSETSNSTEQSYVFEHRPYLGTGQSIAFQRNAITGECTAHFRIDGYWSDKDVQFYGSCL